MDTFLQDLRYGFRTLIKNPGFSLVAILTLAVGIGANTAIFSVINTLLLQPLPYENADRMVRVNARNLTLGFDGSNVSYPNFSDMLDQSRMLESGVAFRTSDVNLTGDGMPERLTGARITPGFFTFIGRQPLLGRSLLPADRQTGSEQVAMLSEGLWRQSFGGDPDIIGKSVMLDSERYTVVGIAPAVPGLPPIQIWRPLVLTEAVLRRSNHFLGAWAKIAPGYTIEAAQQEMDTIALRLAQTYPESNTGWSMGIQSLQSSMAAENNLDIFFLLMATVGLVLLIGCTNIANLLLSRSVVRRQELAIRAALGGTGRRLLRQLLTESMLLGLLGGLGGLIAAVWGVRILTTVFFDQTALWQPVNVDGTVIVFTLLLSLVAAVLFGIIPAWQASRTDLNASMKEGGQAHTGSRRHRFRSGLVVSEVALAVVLLTVAGILITTFYRITTTNPGFDTSHLLSMRMELPAARYETPTQIADFYERLSLSLEQLPGVESAAAVSSIPIGGGRLTRGYIREGEPIPPLEQIRNTLYLSAAPGYFSTMKIPVPQGRGFTPEDRAASPPVAVINQTMAQQLWPDENPVGKYIRIHTDEDFPRQVVGVAGDVRARLTSRQMPQVYVPLSQSPWRFMSVVVRTRPEGNITRQDIRQAVYQLDPDLPIYQFSTFDAVIDQSVTTPRTIVSVLSAFAGLAIFLAALGLYGVVSSTTVQRTTEIGIRIALGATYRDVLRMVISSSLLMTVIGMAVGLPLALAVGRLISENLPMASAFEPVAIVSVCILFILIAVVSGYIPARRAAKTDPMRALKYD